MTSSSSSTTGVLSALVILHLLAGLTACMPETAPLGNPDRAKLDPELSGVWVYAMEDEEPLILFLEPWDRRTWLGHNIALRWDAEHKLDGNKLESYEEIVTALAHRTEEDKRVIFGEEHVLHKSWIAKIGRERFLVWQFKGYFDENGVWIDNAAMNFRIRQPDPDSMKLQIINTSHESLKDVDHTDRKAVEKVIRKHSGEEGFFDEDVSVLTRVRPDDLAHFSEVLLDVTNLMNQ